MVEDDFNEVEGIIGVEATTADEEETMVVEEAKDAAVPDTVNPVIYYPTAHIHVLFGTRSPVPKKHTFGE